MTLKNHVKMCVTGSVVLLTAASIAINALHVSANAKHVIGDSYSTKGAPLTLPGGYRQCLSAYYDGTGSQILLQCARYNDQERMITSLIHYDRTTGKTTPLHQNHDGGELFTARTPIQWRYACLSPDGRSVAFVRHAVNPASWLRDNAVSPEGVPDRKTLSENVTEYALVVRDLESGASRNLVPNGQDVTIDGAPLTLVWKSMAWLDAERLVLTAYERADGHVDASHLVTINVETGEKQLTVSWCAAEDGIGALQQSLGDGRVVVLHTSAEGQSIKQAISQELAEGIRGANSLAVAMRGADRWIGTTLQVVNLAAAQPTVNKLVNIDTQRLAVDASARLSPDGRVLLTRALKGSEALTVAPECLGCLVLVNVTSGEFVVLNERVSIQRTTGWHPDGKRLLALMQPTKAEDGLDGLLVEIDVQEELKQIGL